MKFGILKDIKSGEYRVIATPAEVSVISGDGHEVYMAYAAGVLPHLRAILNKGVAEACAADGFLRRSLTVYKGYLTHEETSGIQNRPWVRPEDILKIADRALDPAPPATFTKSDNFYDSYEV